jgi:arginine/glutamate-rich protein 1
LNFINLTNKAEDQLKLVDEQRKLLEDRQRFEDEQRKKENEEQKLVLGKKGIRPKLSFSLASR